MNIFKKIIFVSIFFVLAFSFHNAQAEVEFICSARESSSAINITVEVIDGESKDWKIGIMEDGKSYSPELINFSPVSDLVNSTKFITTYNLSVLKQGIKYNVLIFGKTEGKYKGDLPSCSFTTPALVNGVCNPAVDGQTFESKPTSDLCTSGDATEVTKNYNNWQWACNGSNGGKNDPCTAKVGQTTQTTTTTDTGDMVDASSEGGGLVPDCPATGCGFDQLMTLINNVIKFLLFTIATPLAALVFVYAGIMLLTSGGSSEKMTTAKKNNEEPYNRLCHCFGCMAHYKYNSDK
jgi:hypothetical protein